MVLQESRLLPTDIFRNIVGTSSRTVQEAWEAAAMAGLAEDIKAMPMGMHTYISEGGGGFSGGQKQRLMIARAIVNKPKVLFFDEATSALDNKAQAMVTESGQPPGLDPHRHRPPALHHHRRRPHLLPRTGRAQGAGDLQGADGEGRALRRAGEAAGGVTEPGAVVNTETTLRELGADDSTLPELLAYLDHPAAGKDPVPFTGEEPHLAVWREYSAEAEREGVAAALQRRFAQFLFPVAAGTSGREDYRAATRRGEFPAGTVDGGLVLRVPERLRLEIHDSIGGPVPVLVAPERDDFVTLVQALTARNEPEPVPASMGACIVSGLNNWDRVARHRAAWVAARGVDGSPEEWQEEFRRMAAEKPRYQDRLLLLSTGPYSAVSAAAAGLADGDWLARSLVMRREHECTHLFTQRAFGVMRNHALDELLADFAGLVAAFGEYRPGLARLFLGVDRDGTYRVGGRLQNYRGTPPLSEPAFAVLVRLVDSAIDRLEEGGRRFGPLLRRPDTLRSQVASRYRRSLVDLAARDGLPEPGPSIAHAVDVSTPALTAAALDRIIEELAEFAARERVPGAVQLDLRLVLDELLSNLAKYARRDGRPPAVIVAARIADAEVSLEVADDGPPFDPLSAPPPRLDLEFSERPIGGLGLHLVRQLTDAASYSRLGGWNVLQLRRFLRR